MFDDDSSYIRKCASWLCVVGAFFGTTAGVGIIEIFENITLGVLVMLIITMHFLLYSLLLFILAKVNDHAELAADVAIRSYKILRKLPDPCKPVDSNSKETE